MLPYKQTKSPIKKFKEAEDETGTNYQEIVPNISRYTKEELLKIVVTFLKKKGKIK